MKKIIFTLLVLSIIFILNFQLNAKNKNLPATEIGFNELEYRAHLKFLSSDLLEGRATGTKGDQVTQAYIAAQFQSLGLKPIDKKSGYFQTIFFHGFDTIEKTLKVIFTNKKETLEISSPSEIGMVSELPKKEIINAAGDLLFAGYFIKAPEYKWDDLKNTNFENKIIVVLVNDPDFKKTGFGSESMTYYGRWIYKLEMARKQKVKGIFLIHHKREATYEWHVVETINRGESLKFKGKSSNPLTFSSWISHQTINRILKGKGLDYEKLKQLAEKRTFKPFSLKTKVEVHFKQRYRTVKSANVIGTIPGCDPILKKETVIYTAHFDHLGVGKADQTGDTIYNGAWDNASGTAAVICLARAFSQNPTPPKRTMVFLAVTAEELGLLGSYYYVTNPIFPLKNSVLVINKDCMNHYGKRSGFSAFPVEYSTALEDVKKIGEKLGLKLFKRTKDTGGSAFRSDHFPFASRGITALSIYLKGENLSISKEEEDKIKKEIGSTYHRPNDEIHPLWRYDGVIQEIQLLYQLGRHWADGASKPILKMTRDNPYLSTMRWYNIDH